MHGMKDCSGSFLWNLCTPHGNVACQRETLRTAVDWYSAFECICVFCLDMTDDAKVNPVTYEEWIPVFIDTENDIWNVGPESLLIVLISIPSNS